MVSEVKFYINDVFIGNDLTAPYSLNFSIPTDGEYVITAWAVNGTGWHNVSDDVVIYAGEIDLTASLVTNDDDAEENKSGNSVDLTSSDIELCVEDLVWPLSDNNQWVGLRFSGLEIPKNATINSAYIQFTADENQSGTSNLVIYQENTADAAVFTTTTANLSSRQKLSTTVPWATPSWTKNNAGVNERTPELKTLVQQIVNKPNWAIGNAMAFLIEGTGTRSAYSRDADVNKSAKLVIKFEYNSPITTAVIENVELKEEISIYPNPTKGIIRIDLNHTNPFEIAVYSLSGQLVYQVHQQIGTTFINFNDLQVEKGIYLIKIGNQTKKILYQ